MSISLVTFATEDMNRSANLCISSAFIHGVDSATLWAFDGCDSSNHALKHTDFYRENKALLDQPRGIGFWSWKPFLIYDALSRISDNEFLIYSDVGIEFVNNVRYIIDRMDQDVFLFGNQWEHAHWCKRDIVETIWPSTAVEKGLERSIIGYEDAAWRRFGKQVQASVIFFRVNDRTRAFVAEWLKWSLFEGGRLIDDSPSRAPNHPEFRENRHDQAILTTLAYRDGYKLHWWPSVYNDGAFTYEKGDYTDDYPPLVHHHRRRNSEWPGGKAHGLRRSYQLD